VRVNDWGFRKYQRFVEDFSADLPPIEKIVFKHEALVDALQINAKGQSQQNWTLITASGIGAMFWGFGDVMVKWFL
jgi:hypothetical protein